MYLRIGCVEENLTALKQLTDFYYGIAVFNFIFLQRYWTYHSLHCSFW